MTLVLGDGDPRHGTNGYTNLGCRCDECKTAHAEYMAELRRVRRLRLLKDPTLAEHGRYSTYTNWMCRCEKCRWANTLRNRQSGATKRSES